MEEVQPGTNWARLAARTASKSHVVRSMTPGILRRASARLRPMRPQPIMAKPVGWEGDTLDMDIDVSNLGLGGGGLSSLRVAVRLMDSFLIMGSSLNTRYL